MKSLALLVLGLCLVLLGGCRSVTAPDLVPPDVTLAGIQTGSSDLFETTVACTFRVTNENDRPLTFTGGSHKVYVNDSYLGTGLFNETVEVERLSSRTYRVDLVVNHFRVLAQLRSLMRRDQLSWKLDNRLYTADIGRLESETTGLLDLENMVPPSTLQPLRAQ